MKILKILILLILTAIPAAADYADSLALLEYAKSIKSQLAMLKTAEDFADLRIWYLRQTQPKIFVELETADNATDMGYFRLDFYRAGKLGRIGLLNEYFNVK